MQKQPQDHLAAPGTSDVQAQPLPKTVRVRIAVAVDPNGRWNASGWSEAAGLDAMDVACDTVAPYEARYWLTAELAIPEPMAIGVTAEQIDAT